MATLIFNNETISGEDLLPEVSPQHQHQHQPRYSKPGDAYMLTDAFTDEVNFVNFAILCTSVAIFGVGANLVNLAVFLKQGFHDTVNVSLFTLALADMCSLVFLVWTGTCFNSFWRYFDIPFVPKDMVYLTGCLPRLYFTRVAGWITSLVAIERCVCVLRPMQVKLIFTKSRLVAAQFLFFAGALVTMVPVYYTTRFAWQRDAGNNNKTILGLYYIEDNHKYDRISHALGVIASISAFIIVTSCTFILGYTLMKQSRWRARMMNAASASSATTSTATDNADGSEEGGDNKTKNKAKTEMSTRDRQALKTVTLIAAMFVVCLLPNAINMVIMSVFPEYNKDKEYQNIYLVVWSFAQFTEAICSASNIFVYYKTSTKFKDTLMRILRREPEKKDLRR